MDNKYIPIPPHPLPTDAAEFIASMLPHEREVHEMAARLLGSSYFMERSNGYLAWKRAKAQASKQSALS